VKRELERIEVPGEHEARERTSRVVQAAFADREPVERPSRRLRPVVALAVALAIVAAALSSPGRAVIDEFREVVGVERAQPALFSLPSVGRLLVASDAGTWVVQRDGSKRLLGEYGEATWSPFGRFVAATTENELAALEPDGDVRWTLARPGAASPRWAGTETNTRIAYVDRTGIRVVSGDGTDDRLVAPGVRGPLAWRPGPGFVLAYATAREVRALNADTGRTLWRVRRAAEPATAIVWSPHGRQLLLVTPRRLHLFHASGVPINARPVSAVTAAAFAPSGRQLALLRRGDLLLVDPVRFQARPQRLLVGLGPLDGLMWSPDGRWIQVGWPTADQWLFLRVQGNRKLRAVANVSEQFRSRSFPRVDGWCCAG
jgi:hypothetical protein